MRQGVFRKQGRGELGRSSETEAAADKRIFALHCDVSLGSEANWFIQGFG